MKDQKEKSIKEPFSPEHTPNPPQIIDPSKDHGHGERKEPLKTEPKNQQSDNKNKSKGKSSPE